MRLADLERQMQRLVPGTVFMVVERPGVVHLVFAIAPCWRWFFLPSAAEVQSALNELAPPGVRFVVGSVIRWRLW